MSATTIPKNLNMIFASAIAAAILFQCLIMAEFLTPLAMSVLVLLLTPINTPFWSLIHEAIHKNFHPDKKINEFSGRAMSVLFGASFHILRFGHLMHHQYNRDWESEHYDPHKQNKIVVWVRHYFTMLGGLYLTEILLTLVAALTPRAVLMKLAPRIFPDIRHQQAAVNAILKPETLFKIRIDTVFIVLFFTASVLIFAQNWPVLLLLIVARGVFISLMDNAYHYGTPLDNSIAAKELQAPGLVARFILNFNHHLTHHKNTRVPWNGLPEHSKLQQNEYTESLTSALLGQFKGPLPKDSQL